MRYSSTAAALLAAMSVTGVFAKPTAHRHLHRHADKRTDYDLSNVDWKNLIDWTKVNYSGNGGSSAAPVPAATGAPAPATEDKDVSVSTDNSVVGDLFDGLVGLSNSLTSFGQATASSGQMGDFYSGNVGKPYGSNMIKVDSEEGYDYTVEYVNTSPETMTIVIWNKVGADGQPLSGGSTAPKSPSLTFALQPNGKQVVAFQSDSQIGFAQACSSTTQSGHFATSFGECNMTPNGPACDLSAILNPKGNTYTMSISNTENDCISSNEQNCWVTETKTLPGLDGKDRNGSCWIPGAAGHFTAEMGGQQ